MVPILITGATGRVGAELVRILRQQGHAVRAAVRPENLAAYPSKAGVTAVGFDFTKPAGFEAALAGVRRIFLMRPPEIAATRRLINPFIDAALAAGVEQIVFMSLLGAERNPLVPHYQVERYLDQCGIAWTLLRPGFFMQNLSTVHRAEIRERDEIVVPAGAGRTSFIDARDIAAVAARTLTEPGHLFRAYSLTGGEALSYHDAARILSAELGRTVSYQQPSPARFVRLMRRRRLAWPFILVMLGIYTTTRLGLAARVTPETALLLGRAPISLAQFVAEHRQVWLT
jgi:uncharacterized protein YbjT (DUF2867 family)